MGEAYAGYSRSASGRVPVQIGGAVEFDDQSQSSLADASGNLREILQQTEIEFVGGAPRKIFSGG